MSRRRKRWMREGGGGRRIRKRRNGEDRARPTWTSAALSVPCGIM